MKIANTRFDRTDRAIIRWEPCEEKIPDNAVRGGTFTNGETVFVGRQRIKQNKYEYIPGYIVPSRMELIVPYGTGTKTISEFEVLVSDFPSHLKWVSKQEADCIPLRPVTGGCDSGFYESYYIGRTCTNLDEGKTWRGRRISSNTTLDPSSQKTSVLPGKIHLSHGYLYVGFESKEYYYKDYEILTMNASPRSLEDQCLLNIKSKLDDSGIKNLKGHLPTLLIKRLERILPV